VWQEEDAGLALGCGERPLQRRGVVLHPISSRTHACTVPGAPPLRAPQPSPRALPTSAGGGISVEARLSWGAGGAAQRPAHPLQPTSSALKTGFLLLIHGWSKGRIGVGLSGRGGTKLPLPCGPSRTKPRKEPSSYLRRHIIIKRTRYLTIVGKSQSVQDSGRHTYVTEVVHVPGSPEAQAAARARRVAPVQNG
jgi:hypothetical protein